MSFLKLCQGDPLVSVLKDHFDASIARIPKSSIKPNLVLGYSNGKLNTLGQLDSLFKEDLYNIPAVKVEEVTKELSGKRSGSMSSSFGIKILEGFLKGFNIPSAGLAQMITKADDIAYSFDRIRSQYIESLKLGAVLGGQELNTANLSLKPFLTDSKNRLFVVVRTYQSKSFNIHFDQSFESNLELNLKGLKGMMDLDNASFNLKKKEEGGLGFEGSTYKTFAFQLVELEVDEDGLYIKEIVSDNDHKVLRENNQIPITNLSNDPVMFDIESDEQIPVS
mgnify:FL=1